MHPYGVGIITYVGYNLSCSEQNQPEKHEPHKEKNGT
jgi:hypothetical protein